MTEDRMKELLASYEHCILQALAALGHDHEWAVSFSDLINRARFNQHRRDIQSRDGGS